MWGILIRIVIGLLLIIHGFAHWQITTVWGSRGSAQSWLLGERGALGTVLWALAVIGSILATGSRCSLVWGCGGL